MDDLRFRRAPHVVWRNVGRDVLLAPPGTRGFELLTGPAGRLWRELGDGGSVDELTEALAVAFAVPPDDIRADVQRVLGQLAARDLIRSVDDD